MLLHGGHVGERHRRGHPVEAGEARRARHRVHDRLAVEIGQHFVAGAAAPDLRVHVSRAEEGVVAGIASRLVRQEVRPAVVRARAEPCAGGAVNGDPDEVREGKIRVRLEFSVLGGRVSEDLGDVEGGVLEHGVGRGDRPDAAAGARVGHPRGRRVLPVGRQHVEGAVRRRRRQRRIEQRVGPVGERDAGVRGAVRQEVAEAVRDRDAHPVAVDAGQRGQDVGRRVRDQRRVVVCQQDPVLLHEAEQVRHLLQVGRDVRVVAPEVRVVELDVDDMLDLALRRLQGAARRGGVGAGRAGARGGLTTGRAGRHGARQGQAGEQRDRREPGSLPARPHLRPPSTSAQAIAARARPWTKGGAGRAHGPESAGVLTSTPHAGCGARDESTGRRLTSRDGDPGQRRPAARPRWQEATGGAWSAVTGSRR